MNSASQALVCFGGGTFEQSKKT